MKNWSDQELYQRCCLYGARALEWRRKFVGLLPEVNRRRLFEKKGFSSIFEFAKKLAGLSEEQVRLALSLDESFQDKPCLRSALVQGEISLNKLVRVRSVATEENQEFLAQQALLLSKDALSTLVRDLKQERGVLLGQKSTFPSEMVGHQNLTLQFPLSEELTQKLNALHNKGLDVNELLLELLGRREQEIQVEKTELGEACAETQSRYIPVAVRRVVRAEHGDRCSMRGCGQPSQHLHHTQRFALAQRHDPRYLAPLCKNHHQIAHAIDGRVQVERSKALVLHPG